MALTAHDGRRYTHPRMALIECSECRRSISDQAESCPSCGLPMKPREQSGHGIPALLSLFVPGLGQIVKGDVWRGICVWLNFGVAIVAAVLLTDNLLVAYGLAAVLIAIIWIYQIVDAYRIKKKPTVGWAWLTSRGNRSALIELTDRDVVRYGATAGVFWIIVGVAGTVIIGTLLIIVLVARSYGGASMDCASWRRLDGNKKVALVVDFLKAALRVKGDA